MNFNSYFERITKKWLSFITFCSMFLTVDIFLFNVGSLLYYYFNKNVDFNSIYVSRLTITTSFNFLLCLISYIFLVSKKTITIKSYVLCICLLLICSIPQFFYTKYSILLILPAISIIVSSFFKDHKLMVIIYVLNLVSILLSYIQSYYTTPIQGMIVFIAVFMSTIIYIVSKEIYKSFDDQLKYISSVIRKQTSLEKELMIEPLTKLYNRKALDEHMCSIIKKIHKNSQMPYVAMIDLDNFKKVNDVFGHVNGDRTLIALTKIINKNLSKNMKAYRFGGEEFVIVMENITKEEAKKTIEKIRKDFENTKHEYLNNTNATLSGGISCYSYKKDVITWLDEADKALYEAKGKGRNQIVIFENN